MREMKYNSNSLEKNNEMQMNGRNRNTYMNSIIEIRTAAFYQVTIK